MRPLPHTEASGYGFGGGGRGVMDNSSEFRGMVNAMTGRGEYNAIVKNPIVDGGGATSIPRFRAGGDTGVVRLSHEEYLGDVFGAPAAGEFQVITYHINPGLVTTFPWLAQIAANYEEYSMIQLIFTYRSTVSDFNSGNGQTGTIIMATQYNAGDKPFTTKQDMMEYSLAMSGKTSSDMQHGVECDPGQLSGAPGKYIRDGPTPQGQDLKTYDHGVLNIATSNVPSQFANQALGELWVSYTVELRKPRFNVSRGFNIQRDALVLNRPASLAPVTNVKDLAYAIGSQILQGQQDRINGILTPAENDNTFTNPDQYSVRYTLPAGFAGNIKIRLYASLDLPALAATGNTSGVAVVPSSDPIYTNPGSGIKPFNDMWVDNQWTNSVLTTVYSSISDQSVAEYHFTVISPTTAVSTVDNFFDIFIYNNTVPGIQPNNLPAGGILSSLQLDIEVYNTAFSVNTVGDNITLINPGTGTVTQPIP